jgi:hypothetical protein
MCRLSRNLGTSTTWNPRACNSFNALQSLLGFYGQCLKRVLELASFGSLSRVTSNKHVYHCMSQLQCSSKYYIVNGFTPPPRYLMQCEDYYCTLLLNIITKHYYCTLLLYIITIHYYCTLLLYVITVHYY